jgi:hypothetical protein
MEKQNGIELPKGETCNGCFHLNQALELLDLSLYAFNQTVNTDIKDGKGTNTYYIASKIGKLLRKVAK